MAILPALSRRGIAPFRIPRRISGESRVAARHDVDRVVCVISKLPMHSSSSSHYVLAYSSGSPQYVLLAPHTFATREWFNLQNACSRPGKPSGISGYEQHYEPPANRTRQQRACRDFQEGTTQTTTHCTHLKKHQHPVFCDPQSSSARLVVVVVLPVSQDVALQ